MDKRQLASTIWEAANKMRSKIEANEYKDFILGFIFYKFLSTKELQFLYDNGFAKEDIQLLNDEDKDTVDFIQDGIGYFIANEDLFSTWLAKENDFNVANVIDALNRFERYIGKAHRKVFEGIFKTLQTGIYKLGENASKQTKAITDLIHLIDKIPMDKEQDYDVLGFVYEYLISQFASNAGKKAGEFYTPHEVSVLMSEIIAHHLKDKERIAIYDPTSGSGSLLINIGNSVSKYINDRNKIKYYAQELKENTFNLTRMNLVMRGIKPDNIYARNADTLEEDWPFFDESDHVNTYERVRVDAVVSNPPYSQNWDPSGKENEERYKYGIAPKAKADYAFLLHDLYHVKHDGIMTIVLPHGVLFRGGEEGKIRKNLIENNHIESIIGLPANIFFGTGIPTIIIVLKHERTSDDVLFVDASKCYKKEGKNNVLRACDIQKIVDAIIERKDIHKFARVVTKEEIRANDYNLNIPRYVDSNEESESIDLYAMMFGGIPSVEVDTYSGYWNLFPGLKDVLFNTRDNHTVSINFENLSEIIHNHPAVLNFINEYKASFQEFKALLHSLLLTNIESVDTYTAFNEITISLKNKLHKYPLIDYYSAYESISENWQTIATDIEIITTEGKEAIKSVIPNLVIKKKDGKESEIQEGWKGRILPLDLVVDELLFIQKEELKSFENRLSDIEQQTQEIFDSLNEEDKTSITNEDSTAFNLKEVRQLVKLLNKECDDEQKALVEDLKKVISFDEESKQIKKEMKVNQAKLQADAKAALENLTDDQIQQLLEKKWIQPIQSSINKLSEDLIKSLITKLTTLSKKYSETLSNIDQQIHDTEVQLCNMIDDLTGSETDLKALEMFKSLLNGNAYEIK